MDRTDAVQQCRDYERVEHAIRYLESNFRSHPSLGQIARRAHVSKFHFERIFKRWAGVSPMQFQRYLTLEYTKAKLADSATVLDTAYDAGLSGPGRLHDLFVAFDAMSPGEFKQGGAGLRIRYGYHPTPFGWCLLALTARGICHLGFIDNDARGDALGQLERAWPGALFEEDNVDTQSIVEQIFKPRPAPPDQPFHLHVKGTNFQVNVWRALLRVPAGCLVSYQDIAACLGRPAAFRAAANAIAANPVAYLIPCHRVIAKSGRFTPYRWGALRKKAIFLRETAGAM